MHGYNIQIHPPINEGGPWRSVLHDEAGKFLSSTTAPTPHGALEMLVPRIADEEDERSGQPEPNDEAIFDDLADEIIEDLRTGYVRPPHLVHVDCRAELSEKDVAEVIGTGNISIDSFGWIRDRVFEAAQDWITEYAKDILDRKVRMGEIAEDQADRVLGNIHDFPRSDDLRWVVEEYDQSNPEGDLVDSTPGAYVRVPLLRDLALPRTSEEFDEMLADVLIDAGLPVTEDMKAALCDVAAYGCACCSSTLYLFGTVKPSDLLGVCQGEEVTLSGGSLLLETPGGGGWNVAMPEDVSVTVDRDKIVTDKEQVGWAWQDVVGMGAGEYPITVTKKKED